MFPVTDVSQNQSPPIADPLMSELLSTFKHQFGRFAVVRFTVEGFHRWTNAPDHRKYLASMHRHLFHVEVKISVEHSEREIEFHDLLLFSRGFSESISTSNFSGILDFADKSCESIGEEMVCALMSMYGSDRSISVSVFEDGEVGAIISNFQE